MARVPESIGEIDAAYLDEALRAAGVTGARARRVEVEPLGGFSGITGQLGRLRVDWEHAAGLPETFIAKSPNTDEVSRMYNATLRFYEREAGFYREIAPDVDVPKPKVYVNAHDPENDQYLLVLEDLAPAQPGDCVAGCDFDTALPLMELLGRLHGRFWMDASLQQRDWLWTWNRPAFVAGTSMLAGDGWKRFKEVEPDFFPPALADLMETRYLGDLQHWAETMDQREFTFCHGDFEIDNILSGPDGLYVLDWQMCLRTCPGVDVAWFLASSCHGLHDRETELLDAYRASLAASGGPSWSADRLREDLAWGLMFWIGGQPLLVTSDTSIYGEHGPRMQRRFRAFLEGTRNAAVRWDIVSILG